MKFNLKFFIVSAFLVLFSVFMIAGDAYAGPDLSSKEGAAKEEKGTDPVKAATSSYTAAPTLSVGAARCGGIENPFSLIACKALQTLSDLRVIIYVIAGFGLIAFTFAAIFNKISWKHLGQLAFSLFLVSAMTPFIGYFAGKQAVQGSLNFGNFLPATVYYDRGSSNSIDRQSCGDECPADVPSGDGSGAGTGTGSDALAASDLKNKVEKETGSANEGTGGGSSGDSSASGGGAGAGGDAAVETSGEEKKNKWTFKDVIGSAKNIGKGVKDIVDGAGYIKSSIETTSKEIGNQKKKIDRAISGGGNIIERAKEVAGAVGRIGQRVGGTKDTIDSQSGRIAKGVGNVKKGTQKGNK